MRPVAQSTDLLRSAAIFAAVALLAAIGMLAPLPADAGSAYDEVPADHWAYAAMDYLCRIGALEGYPESFFDVEGLYRAEHGIELTRYEFAQAIVRSEGFLADGDYQHHVVKLVADLEDEFTDQIGCKMSPLTTEDHYYKYRDGSGLIIPKNHWARDAVAYFLEVGLLSRAKYGGDEFPQRYGEYKQVIADATLALESWDDKRIDKDSLRIMVETIRAEFSGELEIHERQSDPKGWYHKVPTDHWAYPALNYADRLGLVGEVPQGFFDPASPEYFCLERKPTRGDFHNASLVLIRSLRRLEQVDAESPPHLRDLADDLMATFRYPLDSAYFGGGRDIFNADAKITPTSQ